MGTDIVCQVIGKPEQISFIWSAGSSSFDPYPLEGNLLISFRKLVRQAREKLSDLVKDRLHGSDDDVRRSSLELAQVGNKLYQAIFRPAAGAPQAVAKQVRQWLTDMRLRGDIESLEIVMDGLELIPWNVVYESEPPEAAFLSGDPSPARWEPFWGIRYNLAGGRRVEPLRRISWLEQPRVLMVIDPTIRAGLPEDQRMALAAFLEKHHLQAIESRAALEAALKAGRPDLMYWLCHADPSALSLGGEDIGPNDLLDMLRSGDGDGDRLGGLAFLNACQTAESSEFGSFLDALHEVGLSGVVATEHQTIDSFAGPFGLDFLKAFLEDGTPIGEILQRLRARGVPLGLLYGTYCPPGLRVLTKSAAGPLIEEAPKLAGEALSRAPHPRAEAAPPAPLPEHPYRSLDMYDREHRALFVGRDDDAIRFSLVLDDSRTRVMLLHGESGVGKSSFLRAGVIPYLEDECVGYRALRSTSKRDDANASLLFIRATGDLTGQVSQALSDACARPYPVSRPDGTSSEVDLPGILSAVLGGRPGTPAALRDGIMADPALLGKLLAAMDAALPFAPILIIDQAEEVFTLARGKAEQEARAAALEMLRQLNSAGGGFKVIVSIRTEYVGRMIDRLRLGARDIRGVREYLLTDFDADLLALAILQPTRRDPIPFAAEPPFEKYGFSYEAAVPGAIAQGLLELRTTRQDSVLPLLQVVCTQLYERVRPQPEGQRVITPADYQAIGGAEGGMKTHADALVESLFPPGAEADRDRFRALMATLTLQQPDGSLSTALLPADELRKSWRLGRTPFDEVLARASGPLVRLLRVATLSFGGSGPRPYVSLGHDALAKVAAVWKKDLEREELDRKRRTQIRRMAIGLTAAAAVAILMVGLAYSAYRNSKLALQREVTANTLKLAADLSARRAEESKILADQNAKDALASKALAERNADEAKASAKLAEDRRKEAVKAAEQARIASEKSRAMLARQYLSEGRDLMDRNDYLGALPYLVRSLEVDKDDADRVRAHRERLGAILRSSPMLARVWPHREEVDAPPPLLPPNLPPPPPPPPAGPEAWLRALPVMRDDVVARAVPAAGEFDDAPGGGRLKRLIPSAAPSGFPLPADGRPRFPELEVGSSRRGVRRGPVDVVEGPDLRLAALQPARPGHITPLRPVERVLVSRDGRRMLTFADRNSPFRPPTDTWTARVWDATAPADAAPKLLPEPVSEAAFSPDGSLIAAASESGEITLRRSSDQTPVSTEAPMKSAPPVAFLAFVPDGSRLIAGGTRGIALFDVKSGKRADDAFAAIVNVPEELVLASFDRAGNRAVLVFRDGAAWVCDTDGVAPTIPAFKLDPNSSNRVNHASFSPDGKKIVTGGTDQAARFWNAATGAPDGASLNHPGDVLLVAFDGDGHLITVCPSASRDEELQVHTWDETSRSELYPARRENPTPDLVSLAASADAQVLLTVEQKAENGPGRLSARLWGIDAGEPAADRVTMDVADAALGVNRLSAVFASPLGRQGRKFRVVTVASDAGGGKGQVRLIDPMDGRIIEKLEQGEGADGARAWTVLVRFSPDGRRLATLVLADPGAKAPQRGVRLWDAETGQRLAEGPRLDFQVFDFSFDDSGKRLVIWGNKVGMGLPEPGQKTGRALVLDGGTGLAVAPAIDVAGSSLAELTPGGERIVSAGTELDGTFVRVTSVADGKEIIPPISLGMGGVISRPQDPGGTGRALRFSPDGTRLTLASGFSAQSYDLSRNGAVVATYKHGHTVEKVEILSDGRRVATIGDDRMCRVWDERGDPAAPPLGVSLPVRSLAMSAEDARLRVIAADLKVLVVLPAYQAPAKEGPEPRRRAGGGRPQAWRAAISTDGRFALLGRSDTVRVWDIPRGEQFGPLLKHTGDVTFAAFGPNERHVATSSSDGLARLWDLSPAAAPASPIGAHPDLDPGRSTLVSGAERRRGIGRELEILTLDLSPDARPIGALRDLAELMGGVEFKDESAITPGGARLAALRLSIGAEFPDAFTAPSDSRDRWLSAQAYDCERAAMWSAAVDFLTPLIEARPKSWEPLARRGRARAALSQWKEAGDDYASARRLGGDAAVSWLDREARDCARAGLWSPAIIALNELIVSNKKEPGYVARRGTALASNGEGRRAAVDFAYVAARDKGLAPAVDLAAARLMAGEADRYRELARAIAARADLDRTDPASAGRAARALALLPDPETRATIKRLAARSHGAFPDDPRATITWALAQLRGGEHDAAIATLAGAHYADPTLRGIVDLVPVLALRAAGKVNEARTRYREASTFAPTPSQQDGDFATDWLDLLLLKTLKDEAARSLGGR